MAFASAPRPRPLECCYSGPEFAKTYPSSCSDAADSRKIGQKLSAEIDQELIKKYRGSLSLPFEPGPNKRVAAKIADDLGIESLRILEIGD